MATYDVEELPLADLLLDPNNYRFHDLKDFQPAAENRFHEDTVQGRALQRLKNDGLDELKSSIASNGYIPVERVIVRKYEHAPEKWVVLEGNRRVAALKWLRDDDAGGVEIAESVRESFDAVPVVKIADTEGDNTTYLALMGIRHVSGVKRWGGYQEAKLVFDLREQGLDANDIGGRLALPVREVNRRLRAFRALRQMQEDEEFTGEARPELYAIFHEAVSLPVVRSWIGWDGEAFVPGETLHAFYGLISEAPGEDGGDPQPAKIKTYSEVRDLRNILPDESALAALLDPAKSLLEAAALAEQDRLTSDWRTQVKEALRAVENLPVPIVRDLQDSDIELLALLEQRLRETIESHAKLN